MRTVLTILKSRFILVYIVAVGGLLSLWMVREADLQMRANFLHQAAVVARSVDAESIRGLSGTPADLTSVHYRRMKDHLTAIRIAYPQCRFLYLMGQKHTGEFFFYVDSEPVGSKDYSPPGQTYNEAIEVLAKVYRSGRAMVEGPTSDSWGTWISALAPITDPKSGAVLGVMGMDIDARNWTLDTLREGYIPLLAALVIAVLIPIVRRFKTRAGAPAGQHWTRHYLEVWLIVTIGLIMTLATVWMAYQNEKNNRQETFRLLANEQTFRLAEHLRDLCTMDVEGLARFFEASSDVTPAEFTHYTKKLKTIPTIHAFAWAPVVNDDERIPFETEARLQGNRDFTIWQKDDSGQRQPAPRRAVYYPVRYIEPASGNEASLGFDLGSEPGYRKTLEAAIQTGLPSTTDPAPLTRGSHLNEFSIYRPVFRPDTVPPRIQGMVLLTLHPDTLLTKIANPVMAEGQAVFMDMVQLHPEAPPLLLALSKRPPHETVIPLSAWPYSCIHPIFVFDKTFAIVATPGPEFDSLYPAHTGWVVLLCGLLLTTGLALLGVYVVRGRDTLESIVQQRTSALMDSQERFEHLFRNNPSLMALTSVQDRRLHDVNSTFLSTLGYTQKEVIGKTSAELGLFVDPANLDEVTRQIQAIGHVNNIELQMRCKDGTLIDGLFSGEIIHGGRGKRYLLTVLNDITLRKRTEEERQKLQAQLAQSQKMESVGRLAGGVAHDFNNMLQVILGRAEIATEKIPKDHPLHADLLEIRKTAQKSADLTRQLLGFARRQTIVPKVLDLNAIVEGMLTMLRRLIGEDIHQVWIPGTPLHPVKMDPTQIDQILVNLCVNARDAITGQGTITIVTRNAFFDDAYCAANTGFLPGHYVMLLVRDTGCGMDQHVVEHLFEPFFTTKSLGQGTGLGLATVYGIVKQNNGFIIVNSKPGQGTIFTVYLPRYSGEPAPGGDSAAAPTTRNGQGTILLVEDDAAILAMCKVLLERLGYTVLATTQPNEALTLASEHPEINLLITDVVMPEMNGRDLSLKIQALHPKLPCLFMSGYTADVIAPHGVLDGAMKFIQKPFSLQELASSVHEAQGLG